MSRTPCTTDGPACHVSQTNIALLNINGLMLGTVPTKVISIHDLLENNKLFFIALNETWLREHFDAE